MDTAGAVPRHLCFVVLLPALPLPEAGAALQQATTAGLARFVLPADAGPGPVLVYQGSRVAGRGELVAWPGGRFVEFRGRVPRGRFRVRPAAGVPRGKPPAVPEGIEFPALEVMLEGVDGRTSPRYRMRADTAGLSLRGDVYLWPEGAVELRILLDTGLEWQADRSFDLACAVRGRQLRLVYGPGLSLSQRGRCTVVRLPAGHLRPGDACYLVLRSGEDPEDPSRRVCPPDRVLSMLGFGARRRAPPARGLSRVLQREMGALARDRPTSPLDRGDFRREAATGVLWTHGEFDLALGLTLVGTYAADRDALALAADSMLHTLCRDLSRSWNAGGIRLPVRHGPEHGFGVVDPGHVFLEGCLLASLLGGERLLFERTVGCLDELARMLRDTVPHATRLRELAWPLRNLETGIRCLERPFWQRIADATAAALAGLWDRQPGMIVCPENRIGFGRIRLDLWLVSGLLLPALDLAARRGNRGARRLRDRIVRAIAALPRSGGRLATHYVWTVQGGWRAARGEGEPTARAWVVEGLGLASRLRALEQRARRGVARRLPGERWDPATRLALCLRLAWLRASLRHR